MDTIYPSCRVNFIPCYLCRGDKMIEESIGYYEECENCGGAGMLVAGYDQFGRVVKYAKTINVE